MKIRNIIVWTAMSLTLASCTKDRLEQRLDALDDRLSQIEASVDALNQEIRQYSDMVRGKILIRSYSKDEYGNYTVTFTDNSQMTVYSGNADMDEMPQFLADSDGDLCSVVDGKAEKVIIDGEPVSLLPVDADAGKAPELTVEDGRWYIVREDGSRQSLGPCDDRFVNSGFFSEVLPGDGYVTFTLKADGKSVKVPVDDCSMIVTIDAGSATFSAGQSRTYPVVQDRVEKAAVEPTPWTVKLDDTSLSVTAPSDAEPGEHVICIKIFSKGGLCKPVFLNFIVE